MNNESGIIKLITNSNINKDDLLKLVDAFKVGPWTATTAGVEVMTIPKHKEPCILIIGLKDKGPISFMTHESIRYFYSFHIIKSLSRFCCVRLAKCVNFLHDYSNISIKKNTIYFTNTCNIDDYPGLNFVSYKAKRYKKSNSRNEFKYRKSHLHYCPFCNAEIIIRKKE